MSIFVDQKDATSPLQNRTSQGARTGFADNVSASYDTALKSGLSASARWNERNAYEAVVSALNADIPKGVEYDDQRFIEPKQWMLESDLALQTGRRHARWRTKDDLENAIWAEVAARRKADPSALRDLPGTRTEMSDQIYTQVREAERRAQKTAAVADGFGVVGQFAGTMAGVIQDPPIAASALIPVGASLSLARIVLLEGVIGAGSEALVQPDIQDYREEAGLERGDMLESIAVAGAASALFAGALKGGGQVAGRLMRSEAVRLTPEKLQKTFDALVKKPTAEQRAAKAVLEAEVQLKADNPLDGRPGRAEHRTRLAEAVAAAEEGMLPTMEPRPASPVVPRDVHAADNLDGLVFAFDPDDLQVDAKLFQFKAGGDAAGVTDRLHGVEIWDPVKAGQVLVYEFADGRRFIADGHQRLGLAKRIKAQKDGQTVKLIGQVLRESDGYPPEMARVVAAMKNVAEGTGTAIDAAKVLRVAPERLAELPPRSELVRQAQSLANLSDHAFGLVVNEVVPAHFAALVGRLLPDDANMQFAAMDVLAKAQPENTIQAEAMVRQVMNVGTITETQAGLFGDEILTRSLIRERAKVLDLAIKRLRTDKTVFKSLVSNANHITKAGNRLADAENLKRVTNDEQALQTIQTLANRKGPLSDALEDAARTGAEGGKWARAVDQFVASVRDAAARGDFEGATIGGSGRAGDAAATRGERAISRDAPGTDHITAEAEHAQLDAFTEPGGKAASDQADALGREAARGSQRTISVARGHALEIDAAGLAELRQSVADLVEQANVAGDNSKRAVDLGPVKHDAATEINDLFDAVGIAGDVQGYRHEIDNYAIKHMMKEHGNPNREAMRGQIALDTNDLERIPDILANYDRMEHAGQSKIGREAIGYWKAVDDGTLFYVEEVRTKRKTLAAVSMRKFKAKRGAGSLERSNDPKTRQSHVRNELSESQPSASIVADLSDDVEVVIGLDVAADGALAARTRSLGDVLDEIEKETDFLDGIAGCLK